MVAYSFKKQFVGDIQSGRKRQTVRAHRKRHARPGEDLQLFCGMRKKGCFKIIQDPICSSVQDISIWIESDLPSRVAGIEIAGFELCEDRMDGFARSDGFADLYEFGRFWALTHRAGRFEGVVVHWASPGEVPTS